MDVFCRRNCGHDRWSDGVLIPSSQGHASGPLGISSLRIVDLHKMEIPVATFGQQALSPFNLQSHAYGEGSSRFCRSLLPPSNEVRVEGRTARSHSRRRVSAGSCREARRAGIAIASSAGTNSSKAEPTKTDAEVECTP